MIFLEHLQINLEICLRAFAKLLQAERDHLLLGMGVEGIGNTLFGVPLHKDRLLSSEAPSPATSIRLQILGWVRMLRYPSFLLLRIILDLIILWHLRPVVV